MPTLRSFLLICFVLFVLFLMIEATPYVYTTNGLLQGNSLPEAHAFFKVPFAKPPVGELRFQEPVPIGYHGDYNASQEDRVGCPSIRVMCSIGQCADYEDEDCLYMNIYVPKGVDLSNPNVSPQAQFPVVVWFHGGAFWFGSGLAPLYDGRYLAEVTNTIVITMNYRLLPFGFLYMEGEPGAPGNMGFHDQQVVLEWVQENIHNFGGIKQQVTIFGESAGAQTVGMHLTSKKSEQLFQRAIMDSNPVSFMFKKRPEAQELGTRLARRAGCLTGSFECLKTKSTSEIVQAFVLVMISNMVVYQDFYGFLEPFAPIIDGVEFTQQQLYAIESGYWNTNKSFVIGTNSQEMALVSAMIPIPLSYNAFKTINDKIFPGISDQVTSLYAPDSTLTDYRDAYGDELTHFAFTCSSRALARGGLQTKDSAANVYLYHNYHPLGPPDCEKLLGPLSNICGHSYHSSELSFVWRTGPIIGQNYTDEEISYINQWSSYIGNFAYSGNTNTGLPTDIQSSLGSSVMWPEYNSATNDYWKSVGLCAPEAFVEEDPDAQYCDFWDSVGYNFVIFGENFKSAMEDILG